MQDEMNSKESDKRTKFCSNCRHWQKSDDIKKSEYVPLSWGKCKGKCYTTEQTVCEHWEKIDE